MMFKQLKDIFIGDGAATLGDIKRLVCMNVPQWCLKVLKRLKISGR